MRIAILNCDTDTSPETNGAALLEHIVPGAHIIDLTKEQEIVNIHAWDKYIVTGSRAGVQDTDRWISHARQTLKRIHEAKIPCLCICFGMQLVADTFGGSVGIGTVHEEGFGNVHIVKKTSLFEGLPTPLGFFQYHHDAVLTTPPHAITLMENEHGIQAFEWENFVCVQFHPEVTPVVATIMATRDGITPATLLGNTPNTYVLPQRIIQNFVSI